MSQQQQVALIQQMAQLQLMNGMQQQQQQQQPQPKQNAIQPMTFPNMPGYVVIPQNQLAQLQQLQEQHLRQQLQQQQDQIQKYENETKHLVAKQSVQMEKKNKNKAQINPAQVQSRSLPKRVLVTRLPAHLKTVEQLADVFYPYGIISEIQIFKEKSQTPHQLIDIIDKVDPRLQQSYPAATVEFETSQAAKFAVSIMRKREKQLQFRVALLKGDGVDEKHCHSYVKPLKSKKHSDAVSVLSSDAEHISSGYESSCSKSSARRQRQAPPSESSLPESEGDYDTFSDSNSDSNRPNKLGPIAPPARKNLQQHKKMVKKGAKQPVSQFAKYRSQLHKA